MTPPAAGWYPDPGGTGHRYWNGQAWTDHVSPPLPAAERVAPGAAPPQAAAAVSPTGAEPGPTPAPAPDLASADAGSVPADAAAPLPSTSLSPAAPPAAPPPGSQPPPPSSPWTASTPAPPAPPTGAPGAGWGAPGMAPVGVRNVDRRGPDGQILAGWWRRVLGYLLDYLLILVISGIVLALVAAVSGGFGELINAQTWEALLDKAEASPGYQPTEAEVRALFGPGLATVLTWMFAMRLGLGFLNGVVLVAATGRTVGDRVVATRKVTAGRRVPGFGWALLRWLIPEVLVLLFLSPLIGIAALGAWILDYLWPLWDPRRQALHDKAARTFVERSEMAGAPNR